MSKKLIKTLASITCGLGIALSIPSFVSSCGNKETEQISEEIQLDYSGKYLLWGSKTFDITEDHIIDAKYNGVNLHGDFDISYNCNNLDLKLSFEKVEGQGYKFKVNQSTPSGDYEFQIRASHDDKINYSRTFYIGVRNFVPLSNFSADNTGCATLLNEEFAEYDGIYVPDKIGATVVRSINIPMLSTGANRDTIKTLAFDCESEVNQFTMGCVRSLKNLETLELPSKLQGVENYSLCLSSNPQYCTKLKKIIFDNVSFPQKFSFRGFSDYANNLITNPDLSEFVFNNLNDLEPSQTDDEYYIAFRTDYSSNGKVTLINCGFDVDVAKNFMNKTNRSMFDTNADSTKWTYEVK